MNIIIPKHQFKNCAWQLITNAWRLIASKAASDLVNLICRWRNTLYRLHGWHRIKWWGEWGRARKTVNDSLSELAICQLKLHVSVTCYCFLPRNKPASKIYVGTIISSPPTKPSVGSQVVMNCSSWKHSNPVLITLTCWTQTRNLCYP